MITKIDAAREAGYSDEEIVEFLAEKDSDFKKKAGIARDQGYESGEILAFFEEKKQPSKIRSLLTAPLRGALKSAQTINPLQPPGPISPKMASRILEQTLPIRKEHAALERAGELAPYVALGPEGLLQKGAQLAGGTIAGELAKKAGGGPIAQSLSEAAGMGLPGLAKGVGEGAIRAVKGLGRKEVEKLPSGLTKLKAVDKKRPQFGTLSKERQDTIIDKLNTEAAELTKKSVKEHLPISEQIEKGVDFKEKFKKDFAPLKQAAQKYNPDIDISNITKFMRKAIKPFSGLSSKNLSSEAKKMISESSGFINRYPDSLDKLYTLYRQNTRKISRIYEKGKLTGIPKDYLNFLLDFNKEIVKSFEKTLPEDSAWLKRFKETNKEFSDFMDATKTLNDLKGLLSATPTKAQISKLAQDPKTQSKLILKMGEKGGKEVIQIAQDLNKSIDAIKKIPKSQLSKFDSHFPIYYFIPFIGKVLGGAKTLQTAVKYGRYGYGYWLSTPARRKIYQEAVKAINNNDLATYKAVAVEAKKELEKDQD